MLSINPVSFSIIAPTVNAIAYIGPSAGPNNSVSDKLCVPWADLPANPPLLSLLTWRTRISTFAGCQKEMAALESWAQSAPAILIKFIIGEGGIGKSRLAAEFADSLAKRKWAAGFVDLRERKAYPLSKKGTLLVVDYPEENRNGVGELFRDLAALGKSEHRLRILFLTRQQITDWEEFVTDNHAWHLVDTEHIEPTKLDGPSAHRIYLSALGEASIKLDTVPRPVSEAALAEWLKQAPENRRALFVIAAAIYSAIYPEKEVIMYSGREVVEELTKRERSRLRQIALGRNAHDSDVFARLLAMAAIADELPLARIPDLDRDENLKLGFSEGVNVRSELQAAGILSGDVILAPKPDIVAAAFVIQTLAQKEETAPALVWASLEHDISGGLQRLERLGYDSEVVLGMHEKRIGKWLADAVRDNQQRSYILDNILNNLFVDIPSLALIEAAIAAQRTLLNSADDDTDRARLLNNLSIFLSEAGDNGGALEASRESMEVYRRLAEANPARYEPDLAISQNNLSNRLGEAGDNGGALEAIREAVEICRRLAEANPVRYEPDLARSLNNLSGRLGEAGDNGGALKAIRESVEVYRRLAEANPARYEPDLAMSQNNLSGRLSKAGDNGGALEAIRESVEIRRRLAASNPSRYELDLASSLNNLSNRLSEAGDNGGALEAIREAVEIRQRLAEANPARYEPDLAMSLNNLSSSLSEDGDNGEALEAIREAVEIRRRLAEANPARHEPDLARSLGMLGTILSRLERHLEAVIAFKEAIKLVRSYAQRWPQSPDAKLLDNLESDLKRIQEAG